MVLKDALRNSDAGCRGQVVPPVHAHQPGDKRIWVIAYSGYRGEETPRAMIVRGERVEVLQILNMTTEEGLSDRARRRVFRIRGSDGDIHKIYWDEESMGWFYRVERGS